MNAGDVRFPIAIGISAGLIIAAVTMTYAFNSASPFMPGVSERSTEMLKNKRKRGYYLVPPISG